MLDGRRQQYVGWGPGHSDVTYLEEAGTGLDPVTAARDADPADLAFQLQQPFVERGQIDELGIGPNQRLERLSGRVVDARAGCSQPNSLAMFAIAVPRGRRSVAAATRSSNQSSIRAWLISCCRRYSNVRPTPDGAS